MLFWTGKLLAQKLFIREWREWTRIQSVKICEIRVELSCWLAAKKRKNKNRKS